MQGKCIQQPTKQKHTCVDIRTTAELKLQISPH